MLKKEPPPNVLAINRSRKAGVGIPDAVDTPDEKMVALPGQAGPSPPPGKVTPKTGAAGRRRQWRPSWPAALTRELRPQSSPDG